jgi:GrpB-like predicted nucleotidyltransferase (UPF0157 family)
LDEVELHPYDPKAPALFEAEADRLAKLLPSGLLLAFHHIGSTAVPGLAAKPIIDIMALASSLSEARARLVHPLENAGYAFWAANPARDRLFFVKGLPPSAPRRTHHLHVVRSDAVLRRHLAFRDRLRADPAELNRYAALKRTLAARHASDRDAYTAAKASYIADVLEAIAGEASKP